MTFSQEVSGPGGERIQAMLTESNQKATLTSNHNGLCSLLLQTEEAWSWTYTSQVPPNTWLSEANVWNQFTNASDISTNLLHD